MLTDEEYPKSAAYSLLSVAMEEFSNTVRAEEWTKSTRDNVFNVPGLEKILKIYQDPKTVDKLTGLKTDIEETKAILHQTINNLIEREGKLQDLMDKSNDLSFQSRTMLNQSEKLNSCCTIL